MPITDQSKPTDTVSVKAQETASAGSAAVSAATTSNSTTVDPKKFLDLLNEFGKLLSSPQGEIYRSGERGIDYLGLTIHSVTNPNITEADEDDPFRIVLVFDSLNRMVGNATVKQLKEVKTVLDKNNHPTRLSVVVGEAYLIITAPTFDLTISVE